MVGRYRDLDLNREVSKWAREQIGDALLIAEHGHDFRPDLGARGWHGVMNYSGFLRPLWTWLIRDDPDPEQQEQFWGIPVGVPSLDGEPSVAALQRFRAGVPWESVDPLVEPARQPRHRALPDDRRHRRAAPGRRRPADVAARRAHALRRRRARARRRLGRGRPPHHAVGLGASWDTTFLEHVRALAALRRRAARSPAAASATCTCPPTRSPSCARRATSSCSCSRRAPPTSRSRPRSALLETLYGEDASNGVLPADGPAFHIWRIR